MKCPMCLRNISDHPLDCKCPAWCKEYAEKLQSRIAELERELACPCCTKGVNMFGEICQECHGTAAVNIAYETVRTHYKLQSEKIAELEGKWQSGKPPQDGWYWVRQSGSDVVHMGQIIAGNCFIGNYGCSIERWFPIPRPTEEK